MDLFADNENAYAQERAFMVAEQIKARGIKADRVLKALAKVPRHLFVPPHLLSQAYNDYPLPIGEGQTISQPYIVALMTEALELKPGDKVLEVGTGSGYQTTILAEMGAEVYSIEIIPQLAEKAEKTLKNLGYENIQVLTSDGSLGLARKAPFDGIIVTAAALKIPPELINQLKVGGRLVIPVGKVGEIQVLYQVVKEEQGYKTYSLGSVLFVPLIEK